MSWTCRPSSLLDTGPNRKTDARDAHSIAIVAVRTNTLRVLRPDGELEALRMLCDRREGLTRLRVQTVNRLQRLLAELVQARPRKTSPPRRPRRFSPPSVHVTLPARPAAGSLPRSSPTWCRSKRR
jgi:transposase